MDLVVVISFGYTTWIFALLFAWDPVVLPLGYDIDEVGVFLFPFLFLFFLSLPIPGRDSVCYFGFCLRFLFSSYFFLLSSFAFYFPSPDTHLHCFRLYSLFLFSILLS